jgi:hypothetical protein
MADMSFGDLVKTAETGGAATIPPDDYEVRVAEARPRAQSNLIFLTLEVMSGPQAGKQVDVSLWFPSPSNKPGAHRLFARKFGGFIAYPDVKSALQSADNAPSVEQAFELIANSLNNKAVKATISIQTKGDYAGTTELSATSVDKAQPAAAPAPAPAPAADPAPAPAPVPAQAPQPESPTPAAADPF